MQSRPLSVTIISWILVVTGLFSIVPLLTGQLNNPQVVELMTQSSPFPLSVQYGMLLFGALVTSGSGIMMLYGKNWGRICYTAWGIIGLIIGAITSPFKVMLIPGVVVFGVVVFFIFRPKANAYFAGGN